MLTINLISWALCLAGVFVFSIFSSKYALSSAILIFSVQYHLPFFLFLSGFNPFSWTYTDIYSEIDIYFAYFYVNILLLIFLFSYFLSGKIKFSYRGFVPPFLLSSVSNSLIFRLMVFFIIFASIYLSFHIVVTGSMAGRGWLGLIISYTYLPVLALLFASNNFLNGTMVLTSIFVFKWLSNANGSAVGDVLLVTYIFLLLKNKFFTSLIALGGLILILVAVHLKTDAATVSDYLIGISKSVGRLEQVSLSIVYSEQIGVRNLYCSIWIKIPLLVQDFLLGSQCETSGRLLQQFISGERYVSGDTGSSLISNFIMSANNMIEVIFPICFMAIVANLIDKLNTGENRTQEIIFFSTILFSLYLPSLAENLRILHVIIFSIIIYVVFRIRFKKCP